MRNTIILFLTLQIKIGKKLLHIAFPTLKRIKFKF